MAFRTVFGEISLQFGDGSCLLFLDIEIVVEHLDEGPLGPVVILRITGADFAVPVVAETDTVELLAVTGDILGGCLLGMLSGLDGVAGRPYASYPIGCNTLNPFRRL